MIGTIWVHAEYTNFMMLCFVSERFNVTADCWHFLLSSDPLFIYFTFADFVRDFVHSKLGNHIIHLCEDWCGTKIFEQSSRSFRIQIVTDFEDAADNFVLNCIYVSDLHCCLIVVQVPWWALALLCLSKRLHSIFVLRLFNDCLAMLLLHASLASFLHQRWHLGLIIFR